MNTPDLQFKFRLSAELRERLERAAAESGRSVSAEIVMRLEASFETIEGKMLAHRLEELSSIEDAIVRAEHQLASVAPGTPAAELKTLKRHRDRVVMLRDRVKKEAEFLRTVVEMHAVTLR